MLLQLITAVVVIITSVIIYFNLKFQYWKKRNVYTLPPQIPFGNAKSLFFLKQNIALDVSDTYKELKAKNYRYGGYYTGPDPSFIPVDIQLIRDILITDFQHFTDHGVPPDERNDPLSGHLFLLTGAKWKALRIKLTPTFTSGKLKAMFQTLVDCTEDLPVLLGKAEKNGEPVDIKDVFARYTTDVIASVAFGIECNCLKNPDAEFRKWGRRATEASFKETLTRIVYMIAPKLFSFLGFTIVKKDVENFFMNLVKETVEYRDRNKVERKDFMQLLLSLRNTEFKVQSVPEDNHLNGEASYRNGLTLSEITAQAFVFFIAGFETSSTTLNFLMYELVTHPEIQDKLRKDIEKVLEKHDGQLTYEAVGEMTYLDKCVSETLRKYPALPILLRLCTKTYKIPNTDVTISKGLKVFIPVYGIHYDPEFYPDPEKFDPERFSEENKSKRPPATFLTFGEGPRICIGMRLGILQTKVGLIAMLRKFKFSLNSKTNTPITFNPREFILNVNGGIWVDAHKI